MVQITKTFYDVEHGGDIDEIETISHENGGKVIHKDHNYDAEMLHMTFEVENYDKFKDAVKDKYFFT